MKSVRRFLITAATAMTLCGCASTWQNLQQMVSPPPPQDFRGKARDFEAAGELRQALLTWRVVAELNKDDAEAVEAVRALENKLRQSAQHHYQQGLTFYQSGDYRNAMQRFLITLRYQPDHDKALYYLKVRLQNREQATYQVKPGDSFSRIALKFYKDATKAYMIAYFNDLDPRNPLMIDTPLLLPALDSNFIQPRSDINEMLDKARKAYENKQYHSVYTLAQKIEEEDPGHSKARRLADAAHLDEGRRLLEQNRFTAALDHFKQVSSSHKDRNRAIADARAQIRQLAVEDKLQEARAKLRANEWQSAFNLAEEILAHDPGNPQASMLFSNAGYNIGKQMLDRGKVVEAAEFLSRIDPSYEDTGQLLSLARSRMRAMAESHYRDGVKHFINEDLASAIEDWQKALSLNPDHPKARQDIENAQRLLNKLRSFDSKDKGTP